MSSDDRPSRRRDLWEDGAAKGDSPDGAGTPEPTRRSRLEQKKRGSRRTGLIALAALLVIALCGIGGFTFFGNKDGGSGSDTANDAACGEGTITVAAAPEIAETLTTALKQAQAKDDCAAFEVTPTTPDKVATAINDGSGPDVWVPDSSTWVDSIDATKTRGQWLEGQSIASSPVVLASSDDQKTPVTTFSSWANLVNSQDGLTMANPDADAPSRLAFHASRIGQPNRIGLDTGKRLIFMSRFAASDAAKLYDGYAEDPAKSQPFPASEQQLATFNDEHGDITPLRAVMPSAGTLSLDYPWITNPELAGDMLKAADKARTSLGSIQVRESLKQAGFRTTDGSGGPTVAGRNPAEVKALKPLTRNQRVAALETWDHMRTDMRMLAVIDASGSMAWDSPTPGMTRWEVTKGALVKGAQILPAGSEVGAWIFSTDQTKRADHRQLAPVERLDVREGKGTHRDELIKIVKGSDKYLGGDTALYDTIWAAHQKMVKEYDPDHVNSIVVFTDGENDNPDGGLSLTQLLRKLDASYDADKPVRIITIGMGEADPTALQKIADETGGSSYIAETPADIERVFVQALLARGGS